MRDEGQGHHHDGGNVQPRFLRTRQESCRHASTDMRSRFGGFSRPLQGNVTRKTKARLRVRAGDGRATSRVRPGSARQDREHPGAWHPPRHRRASASRYLRDPRDAPITTPSRRSLSAPCARRRPRAPHGAHLAQLRGARQNAAQRQPVTESAEEWPK